MSSTVELQAQVLALDPALSARDGSSILSVTVPTLLLLPVMKRLHQDANFAFDMLQMHSALDWPAEERLECLYLLNSSRHQHELLISVSIPRSSPQLPSVSALWPIAEWQEREVYDMFGVFYHQHPDLRRLLLDDDWQGFPLRKDYQDEFMLRKPW